MTKVIRERLDKKCPCCNWRVDFLYSFVTNPIKTEGLCASCFMYMIVQEGYDVTAPKIQQEVKA